MTHVVDFEKEIGKLRDPSTEVGVGQIEIRGGDFGVEELSGFLDKSLALSGMNWRIWEYPNLIEFTTQPPSKELPLLERARLFGEHGDLSLRRDYDRFLWNYIGKPAPLPLEGINFWETSPQTKFRSRECTVLLWGECIDSASQQDPRWREPRVGWAALNYPHQVAKRLNLRYTEFSEGGHVVFVWWKEVMAHA